jgi:hypothetical protein
VEEAPGKLRAQTGCWSVVKAAQVASKVSTGFIRPETGICVLYILLDRDLGKDPPTKLKNGDCTAYFWLHQTSCSTFSLWADRGLPKCPKIKRDGLYAHRRIRVRTYEVTKGSQEYNDLAESCK